MKAASLRYIIPEALSSIWRNGWMTLAAIITITISLFLWAFFWLLIVNIDANASQIESDIEIVAYIDEAVPPDEYSRIESRLLELPNLVSFEFRSKEDGLNMIIQQSFNDDGEIADILAGDNPLPDCYIIKASSAESVPRLADAVDQMSQIEVVRYGQGTVENLFLLTNTLRTIGLIVMVLLGLAAVLLVAMTTRLAVYARGREIMIMKWVGASNWFIRWPFLLEGFLLGLIGAAIAASLVLALYTQAADYIKNALSFMLVLNTSQVSFSVMVYTLVAGVSLGAFGSAISLAKFLDV
ncbi:MAG: permease-like cell division protein FtsX [Clostridiales bacterium]|jgi:cell division transport system permease protein|nr:permease-like cell division protein FtsX [Clostridiales bacterium]MDR2711875.1 permease-like cell division protein FtsX [Clostridiales bacterium]